MAEEMLEVKNLCKYYKTKRGLLHAVEDISFSIGQKKTLGVVGESGCGKSTLGKTILGLDEATGGSILFKGEDITHLSRKKRRSYCSHMQMIFQDPYSSLDPRMTVQELIAEPLTICGKAKNKKEALPEVKKLMDTVGLAERFAKSYPHELDGGRRQRIGIARALASDPDFIVCDEPVSALDVSIQAQVLNLLKEIQEQRGLTYIFITHNLSVVKHISDEILVMYMGSFVEKCEADELFRNTLHPYSKGLLSAIPVPSIHVERERIRMQGEITSPVNPKPGCRFAPRCPYATDICRQETPKIKELLPDHFVACHNAEEINHLPKKEESN